MHINVLYKFALNVEISRYRICLCSFLIFYFSYLSFLSSIFVCPIHITKINVLPYVTLLFHLFFTMYIKSFIPLSCTTRASCQRKHWRYFRFLCFPFIQGEMHLKHYILKDLQETVTKTAITCLLKGMSFKANVFRHL